jgi:beta-mannosidase
MAIVLQPLQNVSLDDIPPNLTNPSCQGTVGLLKEKGYDPYSSGYDTFLRTNKSYPLPFDQKVDDNQVSRWCPWDLQQQPPDKPGDGVYPYPDDNIERPAFNPCFSACAKNNKPEDCCTGEHNSPSSCSPSEYSKSVKAVCPDAYSYGKFSFYPLNPNTTLASLLTFQKHSTTKPQPSSFLPAQASRSSSALGRARPTF